MLVLFETSEDGELVRKYKPHHNSNKLNSLEVHEFISNTLLSIAEKKFNYEGTDVDYNIIP